MRNETGPSRFLEQGLEDDGRSSAGRRGVALALVFWVVITAILAARVALFDEITATRIADAIGTRVAGITSTFLR